MKPATEPPLSVDEYNQWLVKKCIEFEYDPVGFANWAFQWGHGDLADEDGLDAWQEEVLREIGDNMLDAETSIRLAVSSGHGIGKSMLVAVIILWFMSTRPNCAGIVTANTGAQLKDKTWRELNKWYERCITRGWFEWTATYFRKKGEKTWFINSQVWNKSKPEAFAGLHEKDVLVIYDEASGIDDVIWEVTDGAMTEAGALWVAFSNPTRNTGRFKECFGLRKHRWIARQIDSRTAKRTNKKELAEQVKLYGEDSDFVRVRIKGQFPSASTMQFIGTDDAEAAAEAHPPNSEGYHLVAGLDVARFGDDNSELAFRQGYDAKSIPWVTWNKLDLMTLAQDVAYLLDEHRVHTCFVDEGGMGGGVVDRLRQLGLRTQIVGVQYGESPVGAWKDKEDSDFGIHFANRSAEMWYAMRKWLKMGAIPNDPDLVRQLYSRDYGYTNGAEQRIMLESKSSMKARGLASPDKADALAQTFAAPIVTINRKRGRKMRGR